MIPHAGDEITEAIVNRCLCDFKTAETIKLNSMKKGAKSITYKDVMGLKQKLTPSDVREMYADTVENMTKEISEKIKELNGGKSVNAVFVVGGGGKAFGFTESLANHLGIPKERVALRGEEVLGDVNFLVEGVKKDPLLVTPIGICMNFYNQKNHFIYVNINDERIKLYDNDHLTVVDAAMQIGFPNESLFPKRGKSISFNLNNKLKMIKGDLGEAAHITVNGHEANINTKIAKNDKIYIKESTAGEDATYTVGQLPEYKESISFMINGVNVTCPKFAEVNKELVTASYSIKDGDEIHIRDYYTVLQILQFMDFDSTGKAIYVNGHKASEDEPVYGGFKVSFEDIDYLNEQPDEVVEATEETYESNNSKDVNEIPNDEIAENKTEQKQEPVVAPLSNIPINITITVNGTPVVLKNKSSYIFVDILDFYPFNTQQAGGSDLVRMINGVRCEFTSPLKAGDAAEIYWTS